MGGYAEQFAIGMKVKKSGGPTVLFQKQKRPVWVSSWSEPITVRHGGW
jgi:hypothetical protein